MKKLFTFCIGLITCGTLHAQKKTVGTNAQYFDESGFGITYAVKLYPVDLFSGNYGFGAEALVTDWLVVGLDAGISSKTLLNHGLANYWSENNPAITSGYNIGFSALYNFNEELLGDYWGFGLAYEFGAGEKLDGEMSYYNSISAKWEVEWSFTDHLFLGAILNMGALRMTPVYYEESGYQFYVNGNIAIGYIINP